MEHRWGQRVAVHMAVRLEAHEPAANWLRDVSSSGAFVETMRHCPMYSLLHLELTVCGRAQTVWAYVVRVCEDGIGIEWCNFAPPGIRRLLSAPADDARATNSLGRREPVERAPIRLTGP